MGQPTTQHAYCPFVSQSSGPNPVDNVLVASSKADGSSRDGANYARTSVCSARTGLRRPPSWTTAIRAIAHSLSKSGVLRKTSAVECANSLLMFRHAPERDAGTLQQHPLPFDL
uniref:Uncharacterized protein n=1 Tax=Ralstonia solanacearum CFBP2957 TaxID=859656 RepID=D8P3B9_RALSL|nr:protein of unknown function [Ralstonia solanacearum CFBP2957]